MIIIKVVDEGISFDIDVNNDMSDQQIVVALAGLEAQVALMFGLDREGIRMLIDEAGNDITVSPKDIEEAEVV